MKVLLGTKLGMTRIFDETGRAIPVTAIEAGPCVVTQIKTSESDSYSAVQIGFKSTKKANKPETGHTKSLDETPRHLREFRMEEIADFNLGQVLTCEEFEVGNLLKLSATSKGKGFSGVIKRHHFHRGPETHGSDHHRAPGSIGSMFPQHVLKGQKMPGRMGNERVTVRKVQIAEVDLKQNLLFVKGPVPGVPGGLVEITLM